VPQWRRVVRGLCRIPRPAEATAETKAWCSDDQSRRAPRAVSTPLLRYRPLDPSSAVQIPEPIEQLPGVCQSVYQLVPIRVVTLVLAADVQPTFDLADVVLLPADAYPQAGDVPFLGEEVAPPVPRAVPLPRVAVGCIEWEGQGGKAERQALLFVC
jgi:hypothetical protein